MYRTALQTGLRALAHSARPVAAQAIRPSLTSITRAAALPTLRFASSTTPTSSSFDPQEMEAQRALDEGSIALEMGDFEEAKAAYKRSLEIKDSAIGNYNLGVVQYQLQDLPSAINSFLHSLTLSTEQVPEMLPDPNVPRPPLTPAQVILADTHTNLGAAYILSQPPRPEKALEHLQKALMISPDDAEVCFNLAAVLEAMSEEEEALVAYQRAHDLGIERAAVNVRNIGAKILGKKLKAEEEKKKVEEATGGSVEGVKV
ncbi:hypothetical protein MNV49_001464 [Pseudohyphozyma bogoriensis]|nr:hypothetical protein MNV49_001464 [Pseudohyphozyma bogoriensis]